MALYQITMPSSLVQDLSRAVSKVVGTLLGLALTVLGFLFMLGALLIGLFVALGLLIWALLRGRRPPPMPFRWGTGMARGRWRQATPRAAEPGSEVIDVQVREVDERADR